MCATTPCFYMSAGESKLQSSWRTGQEVLYLVSRLPSPVPVFYLTRLLGCWHKYTMQSGSWPFPLGLMGVLVC